MFLSFGSYVNCLMIVGLPNNLTIVTQGGIHVKLHNLSYRKKNISFTIEYSNIIRIPIRIFEY